MIKDLPNTDKPREKAMIMGVDTLTDAELIAIILRSGTKNKSVLDIAHQIINHYGNINNSQITLESLSKIKGLGPAKAITLLSALELGKRSLKKNSTSYKALNASIVYENVKYYFFNKRQEMFYVLFLNKSKQVIKTKKIYQGTNNYINIDPNEIFKEAIIHLCSDIILVHNHPSGNLFPSNQDIITTSKIQSAGKTLNINLIDHIIVSDNGYYSLFENGDLK